jgi:hypothetical protein
MKIITFNYTVEKDLQNYENNFLQQNYPDYGIKGFDTAPALWPSIKEQIVVAEEDKKREIVKQHLDDFSKNSLSVSIEKEGLEKYWATMEAKYFKRLCEYMNIKESVTGITAYFTTLSISPYSVPNRYFYISIFSSLPRQIKNILHESMHIIFRTEYDGHMTEKGLNKQAILEITEALVVLLNWEFKDFLLMPENNNKPSTLDLQEEVVKLWKNKENFSVILDKLIDMRK